MMTSNQLLCRVLLEVSCLGSAGSALTTLVRLLAVCARALCNLQSGRGRISAGLQKQSDFLSFHPPRSPQAPVSPSALCYLNQFTMALTTISFSSTTCKYESCGFFRGTVFVQFHLLMVSPLRSLPVNGRVNVSLEGFHFELHVLEPRYFLELMSRY